MPKSALISSLFLALLLVPAPAAASQQASASGRLTITQPAGITVIQDVLSTSNISFAVVGSPGDAVSVGLPGTVDLSGPGGDNLLLTTVSALSLGNGMILTEDIVNISIGALIDPGTSAGAAGNYDGTMVVLAQYN